MLAGESSAILLLKSQILDIVITVSVWAVSNTGAERQHLMLHVLMTVSLWACPALVLNGSTSCRMF